MRRLRELGFIRTKPGPSGEFHFILLLNPNTAVEMMRRNGQVQDGLYGRFIERIADVGAAGDWTAHQEAMEAAAKAAAAKSEVLDKSAKSQKGAK
jgi:hypothetical protein